VIDVVHGIRNIIRSWLPDTGGYDLPKPVQQASFDLL